MGAAAELEGHGGGALRAFGAARTVEAGWLIPGGSLFLFELGVRGAVMGAAAETRHELGLFGGARLDLLLDPLVGRVMPFLRGGLGAALVRLEPPETQLGLGPYFAAGVAVELLEGVTLAFEADARARIAPFSLAVGGAATLLVQSW